MYEGRERRMESIDEDTLERIVEEVTIKVFNKIKEDPDIIIQPLTGEAYKFIGRSVMDKVMWLLGLVIAAAYYWLDTHNLLSK